MPLSKRYTRKTGAAGYFFGTTDQTAPTSPAARRRLRHERRKKKHYKREPLQRKHTVRIRGRDRDTNRLVRFKFRSPNPREAVLRLVRRGELNIEQAKL